jgi:SAM-dependent methyltransferase
MKEESFKFLQDKVKKLIETKSYVNIDLGGGSGSTNKNFINVDKIDGPNVDIVHDLEDIPWPFPSGCANLLIASHIVEHINPHNNGFIKWMDEAWRVLKPGGQIMISTPYAGSMGYWQDPGHINGCNEVTWYYFDPLQKIDKSDLYHFYEPAPWKVENLGWNADSNLEVLLSKMLDDKSYHVSGKVKYEHKEDK